MTNNKIHFPAEWDEQSFLQLTFPHVDSDWAYMLDEVSQCFVDIIGECAKFQDVLVVCDDIKRVKSYFQSTKNIYFTEAASNDTWARDHGGICVLENGTPVILDFTFNGWGNKFEAGLDNQITGKLFSNNVFKNIEYRNIDFVLEGGSIESDGKGTILTTSQCLLSKNRNEHLSKDQIEEVLKSTLGADKILWLDYGYLAGDDTDSHIDTLARLVDENTIAYVACTDKNDEHYEELQLMKQQLESFTNKNNKPYKLVELPMADVCTDEEGNRLPATYANFTIINNAVLMPVYGLKQDKEAVEILKNCYPKRQIIPINCRTLIEQHGSLHCVTMQYPKFVALNKENLK